MEIWPLVHPGFFGPVPLLAPSAAKRSEGPNGGGEPPSVATLVPTMLASAFAALIAFQAGAHRAVQLRTSTVAASALLETPVLQWQPPSPPPPVGGGGDGGDDSGAGEFLRLLNAAEQGEVLSDWLQRARIYKLTDNTDLAAAHHKAAVDLEALQSIVSSACAPSHTSARAHERPRRQSGFPAPHDTSAAASQDISQSGPDGRRMLLGLFDDHQLWAVASAEVSRANGLVVSALCVYPSEINDADSTAALRLVHALHVRRATGQTRRLRLGTLQPARH